MFLINCCQMADSPGAGFDGFWLLVIYVYLRDIQYELFLV